MQVCYSRAMGALKVLALLAARPLSGESRANRAVRGRMRRAILGFASRG